MNAESTRSDGPPGWVAHTLAGVALAGFVAMLYWALLFTNRVLATGDILLYVYPHRDFVAEALRAGRIPFWNPYLFGGAPLLANTQAAVLYPLHWPLIWLPVTAQVYWSAALHTWLFGYGGYWLLRRWGYAAWPALVTGLVLAGSGLIGGLIGHLNQLNVAAWLPWAILCLPDLTLPPSRPLIPSSVWRRIVGNGALLGLIVALMLLAGHSQTVYVGLFALGVWAIWPSVACAVRGRQQADDRSFAARCLLPAALRLFVYALGVLLGALIAAPQLLPTLELNGLGLRSGGLNYLDATSFSLKPLQLLWSLLPSFGLVEMASVFDTPAYTEFIAYAGILGLILAGLGAWRGRGPARSFGLLFVVLGLLLALGRWNPIYYALYTVMPGFDLFRAPARWLLIYTIGAGVLAGIGSAWLITWLTRAAPLRDKSASGHNGSPSYGLANPDRYVAGLVALLVAGELLLAARALPHTQPTAPQAVYDLRTAPAHLRTDPGRAPFPAAAGRFLGMSTITYDPGDMADYRRIYLDSGELTPTTFGELVIAQKVQELLVPNLPLLWRIPALDGFDGGLLPLQRYNLLAQLLAPADDLVPDGRLREQVRMTPATDLLNRLHVQYLITDKVSDLWFEDVYYDRQIGATVEAGRASSEPQASAQGDGGVITMTASLPFEATHLDFIGALAVDAATAATLAEVTRPVATVTMTGADGHIETFTVTGGGAPGSQLADSALDSPLARASGAAVAYRDVEGGRQEYRVRLPLASPRAPVTITVQAIDPALPVLVQAATLYDARTGMFSALLPSDRGHYALVHSGDVKIYENQDGAGRAYLVSQVVTATTAVDALTQMAGGLPVDAAVVEQGPPLTGAGGSAGQAAIVEYAAERVVVNTQSDLPALLVLSDAFYPGWSATVDAMPAEIFPTNVLFRGVYVPSGEHTVTFTFAPTDWQLGLGLAALGLFLAFLGMIAGLSSHFRSAPRSGV